MANITPALEVFEGEAKRALWYPTVALAYIYTLSGYQWHFIAAVLSIGGGRFFYDMVVNEFDDKDPGEIEQDFASKIGYHYAKNTDLVTKLFILIYPATVVYTGWSLVQFFTHKNPVIVALSVIYAGAILIVIMNFFRGAGDFRTTALSSEPVDDDEADGEQPDISREED
ncbi:hypothetical protein [Haloparvum sp. AD34]